MVSAIKLSERYALEERVASGGMGSVYAAIDERLNRKVAVKLLREELADDPRFVERFRREARSVAGLSHPNIAAVYDYGEDGDRRYIVMELVAGLDLARVLREEAPLDPQRAADIAAQACDALAHAHSAGVIHRDVKPGNIIVGDNGRVKVTDFGIARAAGQSTLTATGSVIGTAQYLSPEQASGDVVGARSDLYSLGIVLYEMLTGAVPFTGDTPIGIAMKHVAEGVPAPSSVNPDVPKALDAVVAKATAKAPQDRWPDAASMATALRGGTTPAPAGLVGAAAAAAGGTAVLEQDPSAEQTTPYMAPTSGGGWDRSKLQRAGAMVLGALALLLVLALLLRMATGEENSTDRRAGGRNRAGGAAKEPAGGQGQNDEESAPSFVIPTNIVGQPSDEVKGLLEDEGFEVEQNEVASSEVEGTVLNSVPAPGNPVEQGSVITLAVSSGEVAEEDDSSGEDGEEEDSADPGNSEDSQGKSDKAPKPPKPPKEDKEEKEDD